VALNICPGASTITNPLYSSVSTVTTSIHKIINLFVAEVYETKMSHKQYENEYKKGLLNKSEVVKHKTTMW